MDNRQRNAARYAKFCKEHHTTIQNLPSSWKKDGQYWISPYFGSRVSLESALALESNLVALREHIPIDYNPAHISPDRWPLVPLPWVVPFIKCGNPRSQ